MFGVRTRTNCLNCAAALAPNAHFCASCGRACDKATGTEIAAAPLSDDTPFALPKPGFGVIMGIAVLFFGLVWVGRTINGPKAPLPHAPVPVAASVGVSKPTTQEEARFWAKENADLREAVSYSSGIRAEAAGEFLQGAVRYSQEPPSAEPKPYQTIPVYSKNSGGSR